MADKKQVALLRRGAVEWNAWRKGSNRTIDLDEADFSEANLGGANLSEAQLFRADLIGANLDEADLSEAQLFRADLIGANLDEADLSGAYLGGANLSVANLSEANLGGANLSDAQLFRANLHGAHLHGANLTRASLGGANFHEVRLVETVLADVDLSAVTGLETCRHRGPSIIDYRTLQRSGRLPLVFLRGVGLPDSLIEYLPSLLNQPIQMYSCFISYSSKDQDFAKRLHADLQNKGVQCWFAPDHLPHGAKIWDAIDEAIRLAVMATSEPWARKLRDQRNIGDFRKWKDHDGYQKALERLLRDLTVGAAKP